MQNALSSWQNLVFLQRQYGKVSKKMELRQLKYFVRLAETLNFSQAAKDLFITQSTLSHQIMQLENEFQQPLFLRNSHEVSLTEAGQTLLPLAKETLMSADNCMLLLD